MIEKPFFISRLESEGPINLGVGVDAFLFAKNIINEKVVALRWDKQKRQVLYRASNFVDSITAYPTPDMNFMVILKFGPEKYLPSNALLLNDDGDEISALELPPRISKEKWLPKCSTPLSSFQWCSWCNMPDHMEFVAAIGETDWFEMRCWNFKTQTWNVDKYDTGRL